MVNTGPDSAVAVTTELGTMYLPLRPHKVTPTPRTSTKTVHDTVAVVVEVEARGESTVRDKMFLAI
jgi:hypothetical protein